MKIKITEDFTMVPPGENRTGKDEVTFRRGQERSDLPDDFAALIVKKGHGVEVKDASPKQKEKASGSEGNPA